MSSGEKQIIALVEAIEKAEATCSGRPAVVRRVFSQPEHTVSSCARFDRVACITKSSSIVYLFRLQAGKSMAPEYLRYCEDWRPAEWAVQVKCLYVFVEAVHRLSGVYLLFRWGNRTAKYVVKGQTCTHIHGVSVPALGCNLEKMVRLEKVETS